MVDQHVAFGQRQIRHLLIVVGQRGYFGLSRLSQIALQLQHNKAGAFAAVQLALFRIERLLGRVGLIVLRKAFGIILLAISLKLFDGNITYLFPQATP